MTPEQEALINAQKETIAALRKRIAGIDEMMGKGQEERNALVADIIKEMGKLEGMQAALAIPVQAAPVQPKPQEAEDHP